MLVDLLLWMGLKEKLHIQDALPPYFKEGELWWVHMGENIGVEINGKGDQFTRPAVIYKKFNSSIMLIIPTTTQNKNCTAKPCRI